MPVSQMALGAGVSVQLGLKMKADQKKKSKKLSVISKSVPLVSLQGLVPAAANQF